MSLRSQSEDVQVMIRLASVLVLLMVLGACSRGGDDASEGAGGGDATRTAKMLQELKDLYDKAQEKAGEASTEDVVEWARSDLERAGDWEYRIVVLDPGAPEEIEAQLNELGAERWEIFWIEDTGEARRLYIKRPAKSYLKSVPLSQFRKIFSGESE